MSPKSKSKSKPTTSQSPSPSIPPDSLLPTPTPLRNLTHYAIGRGEHLVLTHEPYKSFILPHWRFRTVPIANHSAKTIHALFLRFHDETQDFVGMDMCRKFLQMGMTRAKRYANFQGGRKYDYVKKEEDDGGSESEGGKKEKRVQREKGKDHEGKQEKEMASDVFRGYWDMAREHEGYKALKEGWQREKKAWEKAGGVTVSTKDAEFNRVKKEDDVAKTIEKVSPLKRTKPTLKVEADSEEEQPRKSKRVKREKS